MARRVTRFPARQGPPSVPPAKPMGTFAAIEPRTREPLPGVAGGRPCRAQAPSVISALTPGSKSTFREVPHDGQLQITPQPTRGDRLTRVTEINVDVHQKAVLLRWTSRDTLRGILSLTIGERSVMAAPWCDVMWSIAPSGFFMRPQRHRLSLDVAARRREEGTRRSIATELGDMGTATSLPARAERPPAVDWNIEAPEHEVGARLGSGVELYAYPERMR